MQKNKLFVNWQNFLFIYLFILTEEKERQPGTQVFLNLCLLLIVCYFT